MEPKFSATTSEKLWLDSDLRFETDFCPEKKASIHWEFLSHMTLFCVRVTVFSSCYLSLRGVPRQVVLSSCDILDSSMSFC